MELSEEELRAVGAAVALADPHTVTRRMMQLVAERAEADPRAVARVLTGKPVQRATRTVVHAALRHYGLDSLIIEVASGGKEGA